MLQQNASASGFAEMEGTMYRDPIIKGRSLGGSSDLTILAPLKKELVPSLEAMTYGTRTRRLLDLLQRSRSTSHEYALIRPLSDAVERVGRIQSVRVAVLDKSDEVMLSVSFDGAWESYLRAIWFKVGTLLDLIFCGTEDYVYAATSDFAEWRDWVHRHQVETGFFYGPPTGTSSDLLYAQSSLTNASKVEPSRTSDLRTVQQRIRSAEGRAWDQTQIESESRPDAGKVEAARQGLLSLTALYGLTELFLPGGEEGECLLRAARDLLPEFIQLYRSGVIQPLIDKRIRLKTQIDWLLETPLPSRQPLASLAPLLPQESNVQAGILHPYPDAVQHGVLLLMSFADAATFARFLETIRETLATDRCAPPDDGIYRTVALSIHGLRKLGFTNDDLGVFPIEYIQGMSARAGLLGDLRTNHPRRWRLPRRIDPTTLKPLPDAVIDLHQVHAVLQWRRAARESDDAQAVEIAEPRHPLHAEVAAFAGTLPPAALLLAVESMRRYTTDDGCYTKEHFGYVDDAGQPDVDGKPRTSNTVAPGEFVWGRQNAADRPTLSLTDHSPDEREYKRRFWLNDGSFLAVRKIRQFVDVFNKAAPTEKIRSKLLGRRTDGSPLVRDKGERSNDFDFRSDPEGVKCPFHAHIRRANPRLSLGESDVPGPFGDRPPRLMRRGMSYGPRWIEAPAERRGPKGDTEPLVVETEEEAATREANNARERGILFMAYVASLGEQFEVVQRWLVAGNSTQSHSFVSDPFVGVPESGQSRWFSYQQGAKVVRRRLDGADTYETDPDLITRLEWGTYLFAPSMTAIDRMIDKARTGQPVVEWSAQKGKRDLGRLRSRAAGRLEWKAALEDPDAQLRFRAASIWASIRADHGGVLSTPYGVLAASGSLVNEVLLNAEQRYSVCGYVPRMASSIGPIYLQLDEGSNYHGEADPLNLAISAITREKAFDAARRAAHGALEVLIADAVDVARWENTPDFELIFDLREVIDRLLAKLCEWWFGMSEQSDDTERGAEWSAGGMRPDWKPGEPLRYPGQFTAPSRFIFQPNPSAEVEHRANESGKALREALGRRIAKLRSKSDRGNVDTVGVALLDVILKQADDDLAAGDLLGAMLGFLPTTDGALRKVLTEWLVDGTFWTLRMQVRSQPPVDAAAATALLGHSLCAVMQLRPVPELIWRTVETSHVLGSGESAVTLEKGQKIVLAAVSATQEQLAAGVCNEQSVMPMFGGDRRSDPHPTHACPGFEAAMGVMLGAVTALLERGETLSAGHHPTSLVLRGMLPAPISTPHEATALTRLFQPVAAELKVMAEALWAPLLSKHERTAAESIAETLAGRWGLQDPQELLDQADRLADHTGELAIWGDSWVAHALTYPDMTTALQKARYRVGLHVANPGITAGGLASVDPKGRSDFYDGLQVAFRDRRSFKAVVLSCGGNDMVGAKLGAILKTKGAPGPGYFLQGEPGSFVRGLESHFITVVRNLRGLPGFADTRIVVHGYACPVPDGDWSPRQRPSAWLYEPIVLEKGYDFETDGRNIMKELIDALNEMLEHLPASSGVTTVRYADLRGCLRSDPANFKKDWRNELHATAAGCAKLAEGLAQVIDAA